MFDYLAILISVILGLALPHLLLAANKLIQARHSVRLLGAAGLDLQCHPLCARAMVGHVLVEASSGLDGAGILFPDTLHDRRVPARIDAVPHECAEGLGCEVHFFRNKSWFFGIQLIASLLDIPEALFKGYGGLWRAA
jgi:hypothetical protein